MMDCGLWMIDYGLWIWIIMDDGSDKQGEYAQTLTRATFSVVNILSFLNVFRSPVVGFG